MSILGGDNLTITKAKEEYNITLKRYEKANVYFENTKVSQEDKEKQLKNYQVILNGLNELLSKIVNYEQSEMLGGFHVG